MKAFIEPVMIIFLAVVVGGIIMAVILPMFGLYAQIQ
jgi:type IV pilus assembly protein PilC